MCCDSTDRTHNRAHALSQAKQVADACKCDCALIKKLKDQEKQSLSREHGQVPVVGQPPVRKLF